MREEKKMGLFPWDPMREGSNYIKKREEKAEDWRKRFISRFPKLKDGSFGRALQTARAPIFRRASSLTEVSEYWNHVR